MTADLEATPKEVSDAMAESLRSVAMALKTAVQQVELVSILLEHAEVSGFHSSEKLEKSVANWQEERRQSQKAEHKEPLEQQPPLPAEFQVTRLDQVCTLALR